MIDVTFDFTKDTPHYWDGYWEDGLLGRSKHDPDKESKTLREYHRQLWSKELPNGQKLTLQSDSVHYLTWQGLCLQTKKVRFPRFCRETNFGLSCLWILRDT